MLLLHSKKIQEDSRMILEAKKTSITTELKGLEISIRQSYVKTDADCSYTDINTSKSFHAFHQQEYY